MGRVVLVPVEGALLVSRQARDRLLPVQRMGIQPRWLGRTL